MPIVVLGMHRSGTSLVAGLLHHLGVFMGEDFPTDDSPWCHYEDPAFVSLNQQLLTSAGGSWRNPPSLESLWRGSHNYNEQIQRLIRDRYAHNHWGWKDPRTSLTVPIWHHHLTLWPSKPKYVMVWRERETIVASLLQRARAKGDTDKTEAHWTQLTGFYWGRVINFLGVHHPSYYAIWYEQLLNPDTSELAVQSLCTFCDIPFDPAAISFIKGIKGVS